MMHGIHRLHRYETDMKHCRHLIRVFVDYHIQPLGCMFYSRVVGGNDLRRQRLFVHVNLCPMINMWVPSINYVRT